MLSFMRMALAASMILTGQAGTAQWSVPPPPVPVPRMPEAVATARSPLVGLVSSDDYPQAAIDALEQGAVTVDLLVTAQGRVGECLIVRSSGSVSIDSTTCRILTRRARFSPARDPAGRDVAGRFQQRIRWELDSLPFEAEGSISILRTNDVGAVVECRDETRFVTCNDPDYDVQRMTDLLVGTLPPSTELVRTLFFTPGDQRPPTIRTPPRTTDRSLYAGSARVAISRNGKVTNCSEKARPVAVRGRLCTLVSDLLFKVDPDDQEDRAGTWDVSLVTRPASDR